MAEMEDQDLERTMILPPSARSAGAENEPPKARLLCLNDGDLPDASCRDIPMAGDGLTIGRSPECTYTLNAHGVSRSHARFFSGGDMWGVRDLGSTNGIRVNGSKVHETWLKHGDTVELGKIRYKYLEEGKDLPDEAPGELEGEQTVVMNSVNAPIPPGATTQPMAPPSPEAVAAAKKRQETAARPHRPRVAEESGSNLFLWILGGLVLVLLLATASFFI
jgi:hypothetical protein